MPFVLVLAGTETGRKALVALVDGWRESEASWTELQLAFYDFPAEHWVHIRTTNPVESTLATVRLRTHKTRGCLSRHTAMTMVFKLIQSAQKRWRRLNASDYLKDVIPGVEFRDGVRADGQMEQEDKADAA